MEKVTDIASYIYQRYQKQFGKCIDEMKLHKFILLSENPLFRQTNRSFGRNLKPGNMVL